MISHAATTAASAGASSSAHAAVAPPPVAATLSRRSALLGAASAAALSAAPPLPLKPASAATTTLNPPPPYCGVAPTVPNWAYSVPWHESAALAQSTWYRDVNGPPNPLPGLSPSRPFDAKKLPLIVVHGGPGLPSDYLSSLELLAGAGRRVVFYDQAGCGRSAGVGADAALLSSPSPSSSASSSSALAFYKAELDRLIRRDLKIEGPVHLLGHGWGGILALEYAASSAPSGGVASVVAASTPSSYQDLIAGRRAAAVRALGEEGAARLEKADAALSGAESPAAAASSSASSVEELCALAQRYDAQVVCRALGGGGAAFDASGPRACVAAARAARARPPIVAGSGAGAGASSAALVRALNGGRFFEAEGELKGWEAPALPAGVSVLATRGEFDEVSEASARGLVQRAAAGEGKKSSKAVTFSGAGSYAHLDAWEPYCAEVETWLSGVEGSKVSLVA
jgi:pimeloyl-ACP methyl ester carboxylesterase